MGTLSVNSLLKLSSSLSAFEVLLLGFLVACALGGALVAIFLAIRSLMEVRAKRRAERRARSQT
jgi:hypothetical protein